MRMNVADSKRPSENILFTILWVSLLSFFFARIEIEIEGAAGWAANLPTWRIEKHWLLDIFWGGRAMTGYHAWMFPFIALFFHFPIALTGRWNLKMEARLLACIMYFWIVEDFLWFVLNPAFGIAHFNQFDVPWHKRWLWFAPLDYWIYTCLAIALFWFSMTGFRREKRP